MTDREADSGITYRRQEGFLLATDLGHKVMSMAVELAAPEIQKVQKYEPFIPEIPPSVASLAVVSRKLADELSNGDGNEYKIRKVLATKEDLDPFKNGFIYHDGMADFDFTWHFAPIVASEVAEHFVNAGMITTEQRDALTLRDWADMIGSYWFSDLMHDMALTANGIYGNTGKSYAHFASREKDSLRSTLDRHGLLSEGDMFDVSYLTDETTGQTYLTASLTKELRKGLRGMMHHSAIASVGCPVARRTGTLPASLATDPHFINLTSDPNFATYPKKDGRIGFVQAYTPIDRALDVLALQLDKYEEKYGIPMVVFDSGPRIIHERHDKANIWTRVEAA